MQASVADGVLRALSDRQRRLVVRYLVNDADGVASYEEVADYVAAHHQARPSAAMTALRHTILPMLEEVDVLRYDPETERIRYRGDEFVEDVLTAVEEE
jgi:hypothetical protein